MPTSPELFVRTYIKGATHGIERHQELLLAVHLKTHQAALETMLAEQFVLSAAVLWEVFLSNVLLAYLVKSPKGYVVALEKRVVQSVHERYGPSAGKHLRLELPRKVTPTMAAALLDPKGFNLTVKSADKLAVKANEILAAEFAKKFTLAPDDAGFLNLAIAMRNYLGHRSDASRAELKSQIQVMNGVNSDLAASLGTIGAYLKQKNAAGDTRSVLIAKRFVGVAQTLG